jgi:hypothetical protein
MLRDPRLQRGRRLRLALLLRKVQRGPAIGPGSPVSRQSAPRPKSHSTAVAESYPAI